MSTKEPATSTSMLRKAAAGHSDEIILPPAKAQAAGVETSIIEPGTFNQVIKTSGRVMAAQGDESVAVATVAGVVSFHGKVIEGMSISKGTPPRSAFVQEYGRRRSRTKSADCLRNSQEGIRTDERTASPTKSFRKKTSPKPGRPMRMPASAMKPLPKTIRHRVRPSPSPISGYVKSLLVKEGDYVTVGQPLVSVTQNRKLFLRADVSKKYYPYLPHNRLCQLLHSL